MKSKYILLTCGILITLVIPVFAQTDDTKYFRCLAWDKDIPGLFVTQSDLPEPTADNPNPAPDPSYKEEQLVIPGAIRSRIYTYLTSKPLKIIRHDDNKITLISTLDMQHAPPLSLLFIIPGKDAKTITIQLIDDGVEAFPGGGVEIFNYSRLVPTFAIETSGGKQSIRVDPESSKIIPLKFAPNTTATVSVWVPGKSAPTFSTAWDMFTSIRYMALVVDDPNDKSNIRYTRIPDDVYTLKLNLKLLEKKTQ